MLDAVQMIPCFLCGNGLDVRKTKRGKPYFICDPCGLQAFVRREKGTSLLNKLLQSLNDANLLRRNGQAAAFEAQALLNRRAQLKSQLRDIEDRWDWPFCLQDDPARDSVAHVLKKGIESIETRLSKIAKDQ